VKPETKGFTLRLGGFEYIGAFRVPFGTIGDSSFSYGGTALAYNPKKDTLFVVGHDHQQAVAEIDIPEPLNTIRIENLNTAAVVQQFTNIKSRIPRFSLEGNTKIGGLLVVDDALVGSIYEYYDADANAVDSHFKLSSLDLANAKVTGLFPVGEIGGGFVGGYMATVPEEWRGRLGFSHLTGQAALAIIGRTSAGPAAFGFNPEQLAPKAAAATPFVYYPLAKPLAKEDVQNPLFNTTTEIKGIAFPDGTDSVLFFGSHGVGPWYYGTETEGQTDPARQGKGPHAYPYVYQVWVYAAEDLLAVKSQIKQPWEIKPQDVWTFDLPFSELGKRIGGVAFDQRTKRLFLSQLHADAVGYDLNPIIHVFRLGSSSTSRPSK
jgi:hypothetical protein